MELVKAFQTAMLIAAFAVSMNFIYPVGSLSAGHALPEILIAEEAVRPGPLLSAHFLFEDVDGSRNHGRYVF